MPRLTTRRKFASRSAHALPHECAGLVEGNATREKTGKPKGKPAVHPQAAQEAHNQRRKNANKPPEIITPRPSLHGVFSTAHLKRERRRSERFTEPLLKLRGRSYAVLIFLLPREAVPDLSDR